MKIVQKIMTENSCYKTGRKIKVKGLMLHSVGCPQPKASVFIKNWNRASFDRACVHAFIDAYDGIVYQTLPWDHRGWHCGGAGNNGYIGVEMCEPSCITYTGRAGFTCSNEAEARAMVKRTYESAAELFAYLCRIYGLDPLKDGVILSHKEGCARGIASNHGDPEHLWNGLHTGYTMAGFRNAVGSRLGKEVKQEIFKPYLVQVKVHDLNIRKGPRMNYPRTGRYTGAGVFTIVDESAGAGASRWGKLKSGAGWIALDYAKRV